jgi:large subunit ribosomal protein L6
MSRIGNKSINVPSKVEISIGSGNEVTVKGPKGSLKQVVDPDIKITIENGVLLVERPTEQKRHKSLHGLYRSLINNMITGVSEGYKAELELVGVGYKAVSVQKIKSPTLVKEGI